MLARTAVTALFSLLLATQPLVAQHPWYPFAKAHVGMNLIAGNPVGEFDEFVGAGFGADFFGRIPLDPRGILSVRGDLGFLIYGYESQRVCFQGIGCRVQARLNTTNNIFFGGVGPELALPLPGVRPYLHALWGFSYFNTTSSLENLDGWDDDEFETENFGDGTASWGFGGGLEMSLNKGRVPIGLNLGIRYLQNGRVEYLTEGDIVDNPDGSITMYPVLSEANLMVYQLGISIGIPRGDDGRRRHR